VEELLLKFWPNYWKIPAATGEFNPYEKFATPLTMWSFIILRWAGAALVVPVMEELFWRDYLWRTVAAPNDFKLAEIGERDWSAFIAVAVFCTLVHPQSITALIWSAMMGLFLMWKRSLGACIIAHGVTNFLLGLFVQMTGKWYYW
jgi:CAAX prenyl protease-like protein